jgi:hypothetical protein
MAGLFDSLTSALGPAKSAGTPGVPSRLYFPEALISYDYWMSFSFYSYKRPVFGQSMKLKDTGAIRLPLPNSMVDDQGVQYSPEEAGMVAGSALNQFAMSGGSGAGAASAAGTLAAGLAGATVANKLGLTNVLSEKNIGLAAQFSGVAVNPFLTVLFKTPQFKKHTFTWRLSPTNAKESQTLNNIITALRYNQLPDTTGALGGALLTYPNIVQLSVSNGGISPRSPFLFTFKPAVIDNLSINFTPSNQPSFFGSTGNPTEVEIRISLLEIEFFLQRDYGNGGHGGLLRTLADHLTPPSIDVKPAEVQPSVAQTFQTTGERLPITPRTLTRSIGPNAADLAQPPR